MSEDGDQDKCPVCLVEMDVPLDVERRGDNTEPVIEEGCTRLGCGHALHTECMVSSLISTRGKCVCCNMTADSPLDDREMPWQQRLEFQRLCLRKMSAVKRTLLVREGLRDFHAYRNELRTKHKEFRDKLTEYKGKLREEMGIDNLIDTMNKTRSKTKANFKKEIRKATGLEAAAFSNLSEYVLDRWLFQENGWYSRSLYTRGSRVGFY